VLLCIEHNRQAIKISRRDTNWHFSTSQICKAFKPEPPPIQENLPPIEQMKAALEQKGINLTDKVMKGADHDQLVTLLFKNIDLYVTSLKDLVGTA
jgi:hypothetical protein